MVDLSFPLAVSLHCSQMQVFANVGLCQPRFAVQMFAVQLFAVFVVQRKCFSATASNGS